MVETELPCIMEYSGLALKFTASMRRLTNVCWPAATAAVTVEQSMAHSKFEWRVRHSIIHIDRASRRFHCCSKNWSPLFRICRAFGLRQFLPLLWGRVVFFTGVLFGCLLRRWGQANPHQANFQAVDAALQAKLPSKFAVLLSLIQMYSSAL